MNESDIDDVVGGEKYWYNIACLVINNDVIFIMSEHFRIWIRTNYYIIYI